LAVARIDLGQVEDHDLDLLRSFSPRFYFDRQPDPGTRYTAGKVSDDQLPIVLGLEYRKTRTPPVWLDDRNPNG
jgi:hypothetical protein